MSAVHPSALIGVLLLVLLSTGELRAQEEVQEDHRPLIDQQPFDVIVLQADAGGARVKVLPLPFVGRKVPENPPRTDKLRVVLVRFPEREYEVLWRDIASVELYEQQIYDEALQKIAAKDFIGAFQNLSYLMKNYADMPRLEELRQEFLLKSAGDRFQAGEYRQTLSALEELRATAPGYQTQTVIRVLSQVAERLIDGYEKLGDLASVRALVERLRQTYGPNLPVVKRWDQQFESVAAAKRQQALEWLEKKDYRQARRAAAELLAAEKGSTVGLQILAQIHAEYPMIRVGVMQRSRDIDPTSLVDWSARRCGKLLEKTLFQFLQTGTEGGQYGFTLGTFRLSDDRQQLLLSVDPAVQTAASGAAAGASPRPLGTFELSQMLQVRALPTAHDYDPAWAAIFQSVASPKPNQVAVQLQRPNVLPQALLQWSVSSNASHGQALLPGDYVLADRQADETVFTLRPELPPNGQPLEVIEVFYTDPQQAINDLLRGSIEVLDQVYPADAKRLASQPDLRVGAYALPTTHMLIPVSDHAYLANVKFRKALLVGTDRKSILTRELLGGEDPSDGRLISGPFPIGRGGNDPLAYAYNNNVQPAPTNPELGKLLLAMSRKEIREEAKRSGQAEPALEKLIVGCPNYGLARVATEALIQQWSALGIEAEMLVLDTEESFTRPVDLVYAMTTMWEPATDVQRLLGSQGPASTDNPFIVQALETLRVARNWREVRTALQDLHQLIDYHLPVLPLWQITDRFAVRRSLEGLQNQPLSLYQDVSAWRFQVGP